MSAHDQPKKPLWRLYREVTQYEYTDPDRAFEIFETEYEHLSEYTGNPDEWHNTSMVAARVGHRDAELRLIECGLAEWPDNVDLMCDELQLRISSHFNPTRAQEIATTLENMDLSRKAPYWRYWVYLAIYYARFLHNPQRALELLDEGIRRVRRDEVMDILRSYRRIFVDSVPLREIRNDQELEEYHQEALRLLEERYQLGLRLGVENGYVLAQELARLYQEQAGREETHFPEPQRQTPEMMQESKQPESDYLQKALDYLELAERLYTGDSNHPISGIYEQRLRILMAQRRFGEALQLIQSLRYTLRGRIRQDFSPAIMWERAARSTGQPLDELEEILGIPKRSTTPSDTALNEAVNLLFAQDGQLLEQLARRSPEIRNILLAVARRL